MSKAETSFSFPRPRRELLAPLLALALAGCGASKAEEAPEAVNTGTNVALEAGSTPAPAASTPENSGVSETLQKLCDPAFTYDGQMVAGGTPQELIDTRWIQPNSDVTKEDVLSELPNAEITAGVDADSMAPVEADTLLPIDTKVSVSFQGACDQ